MSALRLIASLAAIGIPVARAAPQSPDLRAMSASPIAPRGGVMLVPFAISGSGMRAHEDIPDEVRLELEDGRFITGRFGWLEIEPATGEAARAWSHEALRAEIRSPRAFTAARARDGAAAGPPAELVLLARLPKDGTGRIWIEALGLSLDPQWMDLPELADDGVALEGGLGSAWPSRENPLAHWRWELLAWELNRSPPEARGTELERLLAEHLADVWLAGLHRLELNRPAVAAACRELLTAVALDGEQAFAAWVVDPDALRALRTILLDETLNEEQRALSALGWADRQPPLLVWPESADQRAVRLAVVNRKLGYEVARFQWEREGEIPLAVELGGRRLTRVTMDRPAQRAPLPGPLGEASRGEPESDPPVLAVRSGMWSARLEAPPRAVAVRPPGLAIGPLRPPLTLQEAERGTATPTAPGLATVVELRNLQGRWEFLVEAFHGQTRSSGTEPAGETRGRRDRVTITLRPQGGQEVALTVDERGRLSIGTAEAAMVLPGVAVRHRAFEDRWRTRVILPADWLGQLRTGATAANQDGGAAADDARRPIVHLSIERRLGNGRRLSGPLVTAPWRGLVGTTIAVDLGAWDVLETAP